MLARPQQPAFLPPPPSISPAGHALFIDFDGTLVRLVDRPDQVRADPDLINLLRALLSSFGRRLAIISGRSIAQLDRMIGPLAERITLAGSHGAEHRYGGVLFQPARPEGLEAASEDVRAFAARHPGMIVEPKSLGIALHYRMLPSLAPETNAAARVIALRHGLSVQPGKMMIELRGPGCDKGTAVSALLERPALRGCVPVVIGDDLTDEPALAVAEARDGIGILVGGGRPSAASYALADIGAVRDWLWQVARAGL